ncbi:MAG TPA: hypothetical protein VMV92_16855 [Streptosporangiaceae bacterium]|nr:hypothetical protein [Streptosporangiaceae bacterium]
MSRAPAADLDRISLARLRLAVPEWPVIAPVLGGWSAARPTEHGGLHAVYAPSLEQLVGMLAAADREQEGSQR